MDCKKVTATDKSVNYHLFRGAAWSVMSRWSLKAIGLVNTMVLARLLTPQDFGVVAMASLVVGLLYSFSELGVQTYLIREKNVDNELCNTAWTLQVVQYSLIAIFLVLLAPYTAIYFDEPRVTAIIYFLAFSSFIEGFGNIGVVFFLKDLSFRKDFKFNIIKRLLVFFVTIAAAFELKNYWALVFGQIVGTFLGVIVSYLVHSYRPRFSLIRSRELLKFATAIIPMNIGVYFNNKVDVLIVGGIGNTSQLGLYNMASELSSIFTKELVIPIGRGLFPNFAKLKNEPEKLASAFMSAFKAIITISLPLGIGLWTVAEDFILVVLGQKWLSILPFIKWLIFYSLSDCIINFINGRILVVTGRERLAGLLVWLRVFVVTGSALTIAMPIGVEAVAPVLTISTVALFPLGLFILSNAIKERFTKISSVFLSPLLASLLMMIAIDYMPFVLIENDVVRLLSKVSFGIITYILCIYLLWFGMRKPEGIEKAIFNYFANKSIMRRSKK